MWRYHITSKSKYICSPVFQQFCDELHPPTWVSLYPGKGLNWIGNVSWIWCKYMIRRGHEYWVRHVVYVPGSFSARKKCYSNDILGQRAHFLKRIATWSDRYLYQHQGSIASKYSNLRRGKARKQRITSVVIMKFERVAQSKLCHTRSQLFLTR